MVFGYSPPYILSSFEGLGGVDADVQRQKSPYQDGSTHIDTLLMDRPIPLTFSIMADSHLELVQHRKHLSSVCNPKLRGELRFEDENIVRVIDVECENSPFFPSGDSRGPIYQIGTIDWIALNPYWKSPSIEEQPTFEPLFQFPFEGAFQMGIQRDLRIIDNDSDAEVPIQVEFYGPAINPIIINNTTGEFIKVNQTLGENEYMRIDTTPGEKSVFFVAEDGTERNVFNWIDPESEFFQLGIGEVEIEYSADNDIQGAIVNIYWQKHYVGI